MSEVYGNYQGKSVFTKEEVENAWKGLMGEDYEARLDAWVSPGYYQRGEDLGFASDIRLQGVIAAIAIVAVTWGGSVS